MTVLTLPAADGVLLENPVQWWYWTGHLATPDGRRFGVESCFFVFTEETLLQSAAARRTAAAPWLAAEDS